MEGSMEHGGTGIGGFFELVLIIAAITLVASGVLYVVSLGSVPLTKHATEVRAEETWNPTTIQDHITKGRCIPQTYSCIALDFDVTYCELKPGLSIGLFIGRTVEQIITGYAARTDYWANRCEH